MTTNAILALEDGRVFPCRSFTGPGEASGEVVFNTSMTGYQEVLTDPSYRGQLVTMTYPLMGNYGINPEDVESANVQVAGFLIREYQEQHSNWRATESLADYLNASHIMGVDGLDTRALTRHIRTVGALRAVITTELDTETAIQQARRIPSMAGLDLASQVSTSEAYFWRNNMVVPCENQVLDTTLWPSKNGRKRVVVLDYGVKYNILRHLTAVGCEVLVVPAGTTADTIRHLTPDGIFLSNGPGDPEPLQEAVATIRNLIGYRPLFGICLGVQLLGLALGGRTFKLKFGHRGSNQPVHNLLTGRVEITSQNHGFAVDPASLDSNDVEITHINLNDRTLEGFRHRQYPVFAVQYHPEAAPGPHDADYLFKQFAALVQG